MNLPWSIKEKVTRVNRTLSCCLHITLGKWDFLHISALTVLFCIETLFFFQNYRYEIEGLHFAGFCCFTCFFFLPPSSENNEAFVKFTKILLLPVYLTLKAQTVCNSNFQHAAFVLLVIVCCSSLWRAKPNGSWKQSG